VEGNVTGEDRSLCDATAGWSGEERRGAERKKDKS
jgi:hypothetical protein